MERATQAVVSPFGTVVDGTAISYEVERQIVLNYGIVELGKHCWSSPIEFELYLSEESVAFNLALSPRPTGARIERLNLPDFPNDRHDTMLERVMLLDPGGRYRLSMPPGKVRSLYCGLHRSQLEGLIGGPADFSARNWQLQSKWRLPAIELLLNRIYEELREDNFASEVALEAYGRTLCVELARCLRSNNEKSGRSRKGGLAPWRMRLLRERVYAEAPAPHLSELSELCGLTIRQLSRAFKEETGKTLGGFIGEVTSERAVRLLTQTNRPIAEIAADLGFATPAGFSYSFRRATGLLPRELRKRSEN